MLWIECNMGRDQYYVRLLYLVLIPLGLFLIGLALVAAFTPGARVQYPESTPRVPRRVSREYYSQGTPQYALCSGAPLCALNPGTALSSGSLRLHGAPRQCR